MRVRDECVRARICDSIKMLHQPAARCGIAGRSPRPREPSQRLRTGRRAPGMSSEPPSPARRPPPIASARDLASRGLRPGQPASTTMLRLAPLASRHRVTARCRGRHGGHDCARGLLTGAFARVSDRRRRFCVLWLRPHSSVTKTTCRQGHGPWRIRPTIGFCCSMPSP
jgi:hypothetical protein